MCGLKILLSNFLKASISEIECAWKIDGVYRGVNY